ncbi:MAG: hypothetical protein ACLR8P_15375 [Clostridium fessum]
MTGEATTAEEREKTFAFNMMEMWRWIHGVSLKLVKVEFEVTVQWRSAHLLR